MSSKSKNAKAKGPAVPAAIASQVTPVLFYTGSGATPDGVPARDLTVADLIRVHRIRSLKASGGQPVDPATDADVAAISAELAARDAFSTTAPPAPAEAAPDEQPAGPAESEE